MVFFETAGPDECMVLSGCCLSAPKLVVGGRVFVWPFIQQLDRLSLNVMTLPVDSNKVYTKEGVPIFVQGVAQVKVEGKVEDMLRLAVTQFLQKTPQQIRVIALETLEGHQRAIMGTMTVEEIYRDRKKFAEAVFQVAASDLSNMGLTIVSYTIKDVRDEVGYLHNLGLKRTAEVKRDAAIGEAFASRDAGIKEAIAEQARMSAKFTNDTEIAKSKRDYELRQAAFNEEVNTKQAISNLAYKLQAAKQQQSIREENVQIQVVERRKQIQVMEQEILRKERELEATVHQPAKAEQYKVETLAEANKAKVLRETEAQAKAIELKGKAEAQAIAAKGRAEAEQMAEKARAWEDYGDAATMEMVLAAMPRIAAEIAAPLAQTESLTLVSTGGKLGASKVTDEVTSIMMDLPKLVESMTGVNVTAALQGSGV